MSVAFYRDGSGFSLIETIIVMVLLGILAVVTLPSLTQALQTLHLNQAANKLAADIRYAKETALNSHGTYGVEFDVDDNSYSVFQLVSGSKASVNDPFTNASMIMDFDTHSEYSGVSMVSSGSTEIRFDSFGIPYDATGTALSNPLTVVIQNGGSSKTISITQQTSFIEIT